MGCLSVALLIVGTSLQSLTASDVPPAPIQSMKRLKSYLETRLDPEIPPLDPETNSIHVSVRLGPLQVHDLVDSTQVLTLGSLVIMGWRDKSLAWNTSDFSNISQVEIPLNKVWQPNVHLSNKAFGDGPLATMTPIHLKSDGYLYWKNTMTISVICKTFLSRYPFDSQVCPMNLMPLNEYDTLLHPSVDFSTHGMQLDANGEWQTVNVTSSLIIIKESLSQGAIFHVHLSRKYLFHVLNLVFPMCLLSFLNSLVFLVPASSGEKMGFLMAVFVSNALFLNLIHDSMPSTSDTISYLSVYLVAIQIQGFLAIAATIVVQNVYYRQMSRKESGAEITQVVPQDCLQNTMTSPTASEIPAVQTDRKLWKKINCFKNRTAPPDRYLDGVFFVCFTIFAIAGILFLILG